MLFPFMDQAPLYNQLNVGTVTLSQRMTAAPALFREAIVSFRCPSDTGNQINDAMDTGATTRKKFVESTTPTRTPDVPFHDELRCREQLSPTSPQPEYQSCQWSEWTVLP